MNKEINDLKLGDKIYYHKRKNGIITEELVTDEIVKTTSHMAITKRGKTFAVSYVMGLWPEMTSLDARGTFYCKILTPKVLEYINSKNKQ